MAGLQYKRCRAFVIRMIYNFEAFLLCMLLQISKTTLIKKKKKKKSAVLKYDPLLCILQVKMLASILL